MLFGAGVRHAQAVRVFAGHGAEDNDRQACAGDQAKRLMAGEGNAPSAGPACPPEGRRGRCILGARWFRMWLPSSLKRDAGRSRMALTRQPAALSSGAAPATADSGPERAMAHTSVWFRTKVAAGSQSTRYYKVQVRCISIEQAIVPFAAQVVGMLSGHLPRSRPRRRPSLPRTSPLLQLRRP